MATPISVQFPVLTNSRVWFVDKNAFNTWAASNSFTLTGANLPTPTLTTLGGVKLMALDAINWPANYAGSYSINLDDGSQAIVPSNDAYVSLVARVLALETWISALRAELLAKGYIGS